MALTNLFTPVPGTDPHLISDYITFSTDAVAGIANTISSTANGNTGTLASTTGFVRGDAVTITNGGIGGNTPWYHSAIDVNSGTSMAFGIPSVITTVAAQAITRWERITLRFKPREVILTNLTNGDVYVWRLLFGVRTCQKASGGVTSIITGNNIWVSSRNLYIHPDILPISSNYHVQAFYQ